jgi:hypothetical protein
MRPGSVHRDLHGRVLTGGRGPTVRFDGRDAYRRPRARAQNAGHHLVGAGRLDELKALLASPGWLERKLHSYGTAAVVADFRRHLMVAADEEVKLLLEAFQMSISACLAHPGVPLLRAQMLGRLMAAAAAASLPGRLAAEEAAPEEAGRHAAAPPCLFSRTPSLEQARAPPLRAARWGRARRAGLAAAGRAVCKLPTRRVPARLAAVRRAFHKLSLRPSLNLTRVMGREAKAPCCGSHGSFAAIKVDMAAQHQLRLIECQAFGAQGRLWA